MSIITVASYDDFKRIIEGTACVVFYAADESGAYVYAHCVDGTWVVTGNVATFDSKNRAVAPLIDVDFPEAKQLANELSWGHA
jgi:hypothetical protein